ncbi:hypothetical protein A210_27130 [Pseudomonas putida SJTE-1]|nr:hypothetical protein A210_27130 [Pseudomonas putida SJTE-1]
MDIASFAAGPKEIMTVSLAMISDISPTYWALSKQDCIVLCTYLDVSVVTSPVRETKRIKVFFYTIYANSS